MSPIYERDKVVAYMVASGRNFETVCTECIQENDKVEDAYDENDQENYLIICDRCDEEC